MGVTETGLFAAAAAAAAAGAAGAGGRGGVIGAGSAAAAAGNTAGGDAAAAAAAAAAEGESLFRATLIRLSATEHSLVLVWNPLIFDGVSSSLFYSDLLQVYKAGGSAADLPAVASYADFVLWERDNLACAGHREWDLAFWKQAVGVPPPKLPAQLQPKVEELGGGGGRTGRGAAGAGAGGAAAAAAAAGAAAVAAGGLALAVRRGHAEVQIPASTRRRIETYAFHRGATLAMALQTLLHTLLHLWTHQDSVAVAVPFARRQILPLQAVIGRFSDLLPVVTDMRKHLSPPLVVAGRLRSFTSSLSRASSCVSSRCVSPSTSRPHTAVSPRLSASSAAGAGGLGGPGSGFRPSSRGGRSSGKAEGDRPGSAGGGGYCSSGEEREDGSASGTASGAAGVAGVAGGCLRPGLQGRKGDGRRGGGSGGVAGRKLCLPSEVHAIGDADTPPLPSPRSSPAPTAPTALTAPPALTAPTALTAPVNAAAALRQNAVADADGGALSGEKPAGSAAAGAGMVKEGQEFVQGSGGVGIGTDVLSLAAAAAVAAGAGRGVRGGEGREAGSVGLVPGQQAGRVKEKGLEVKGGGKGGEKGGGKGGARTNDQWRSAGVSFEQLLFQVREHTLQALQHQSISLRLLSSAVHPATPDPFASPPAIASFALTHPGTDSPPNLLPLEDSLVGDLDLQTAAAAVGGAGASGAAGFPGAGAGFGAGSAGVGGGDFGASAGGGGWGGEVTLFPLGLSLRPLRDGRLAGRLTYQVDSVSREIAEVLARQLERLAEAAVESPRPMVLDEGTMRLLKRGARRGGGGEGGRKGGGGGGGGMVGPISCMPVCIGRDRRVLTRQGSSESDESDVSV
ncbi:hypothetical protein CLOM_g19379 [Closterium sp. NIES-68]|nr:hypothetical protein CLOM_g19379 [Closterium sp. NIES-68]